MKLYYRGLSYEYDPSKVASKKTEQPFESAPQIGPAYDSDVPWRYLSC
ncbi:MAG: DUF4278 domain-containing protein [Nostoc sp.]